jgi:hypothetical protein
VPDGGDQPGAVECLVESAGGGCGVGEWFLDERGDAGCGQGQAGLFVVGGRGGYYGVVGSVVE